MCVLSSCHDGQSNTSLSDIADLESSAMTFLGNSSRDMIFVGKSASSNVVYSMELLIGSGQQFV